MEAMAETKFESDRAFTWTLVDPWQLLTKRLGCCRYPLQLIHVGERFDEILQRGWAHQVHQLTAQEAAAELWMDRVVNHVIRFIIRFTQVHLKLYLNLLRRLVVEAGVSLEAQLVFPLFAGFVKGIFGTLDRIRQHILFFVTGSLQEDFNIFQTESPWHEKYVYLQKQHPIFTPLTRSASICCPRGYKLGLSHVICIHVHYICITFALHLHHYTEIFRLSTETANLEEIGGTSAEDLANRPAWACKALIR